MVKFYGELSEWSNEHDWKSCIRHKRIGGSNPPLSANKIGPSMMVLFYCLECLLGGFEENVKKTVDTYRF